MIAPQNYKIGPAGLDPSQRLEKEERLLWKNEDVYPTISNVLISELVAYKYQKKKQHIINYAIVLQKF